MTSPKQDRTAAFHQPRPRLRRPRSLDLGDELQFLDHAGGRPRCQQSLADYAEVAAALADTAPAVEPGQQLGDRIMAAATGGRTRGSGDRPPGPPPAAGGACAAGRRTTARGHGNA